METNALGNSDLLITPVGFGAWAIGGDWEFGWGAQDDAQSIAAIHRALELGVNWIDTAAVYGLGHSEEVVARALQERPGPTALRLYQMRHDMGRSRQGRLLTPAGINQARMRS